MAKPGDEARESDGAAAGPAVTRSIRAAMDALGVLIGGLGTALAALLVLGGVLVTAALSLVGVGLPIAPLTLRAMHALAGRERSRLSRRGPEIIAPDPPPTRALPALRDPVTRREVAWTAYHASGGLLLGLLGLLLPLFALRDVTYPLWWKLAPGDANSTSLGTGPAHSWPEAFASGALGLAWIAIVLGLGPAMARLQAVPARRLLAAGPETDLSLRVAELTASRAAALDAHAAELRRIERSLHDGTQNRLVAVTVLLGAADRGFSREPAGAQELVQRARDAAELALAELRAVVRSIQPPVLAERGLAAALDGLAAGCPVPCETEIDLPGRYPASVEAIAYFTVAEALTNIAKHSGAAHAAVRLHRRGDRLRLTVTDDGHGGAGENEGTGLAGIRRRVAALDGTLTVTSPAGGPTTIEVVLPCGS